MSFAGYRRPSIYVPSGPAAPAHLRFASDHCDPTRQESAKASLFRVGLSREWEEIKTQALRTRRWSRLAIASCGMVRLLAASCSTFSLARTWQTPSNKYPLAHAAFAARKSNRPRSTLAVCKWRRRQASGRCGTVMPRVLKNASSIIPWICRQRTSKQPRHWPGATGAS